MEEIIGNAQAKSLVIGGTGLVGGYIVEHLVRRGERPFALSRSLQDRPGVDWFRGDLEKPDDAEVPAVCNPLLHRRRVSAGRRHFLVYSIHH